MKNLSLENLRENRRKNRWTALVALSALGLTTLALAHAHLVSATPAPNSHGKGPTQIVLKVSEKLEPAFSKIALFSVAQKEPAPIETDRPSQVSPDGLTLSMTLSHALAAGQYEVRWKVTSVDTHKSQGRYRFTVNP